MINFAKLWKENLFCNMLIVDRVTNLEVLNKHRETVELMDTIKHRMMSYIGYHDIRNYKDYLLQLITHSFKTNCPKTKCR